MDEEKRLMKEKAAAAAAVVVVVVTDWQDSNSLHQASSTTERSMDKSFQKNFPDNLGEDIQRKTVNKESWEKEAEGMEILAIHIVASKFVFWALPFSLQPTK
jgi:hypothetical protein